MCNAISERRPFDQLKHQGPSAFCFFKTVDRGNARMVQAGEHLRFPLEAGEPIRIRGERFGQDLERDLPIELGIGGLIDLAHPALTNEGSHVVVAESGADSESHKLSRLIWASFYRGGMHDSSPCTELPLRSVRTPAKRLQPPVRW